MKGYESVKELLERELDDYSFFNCGEINIDKAYEQTDEDEYYKVEITKGNDKVKTLNFHYNKKDDLLEIELGEDNYHEVTDYNWNVKYFWMALLDW